MRSVWKQARICDMFSTRKDSACHSLRLSLAGCVHSRVSEVKFMKCQIRDSTLNSGNESNRRGLCGQDACCVSWDRDSAPGPVVINEIFRVLFGLCRNFVSKEANPTNSLFCTALNFNRLLILAN